MGICSIPFRSTATPNPARRRPPAPNRQARRHHTRRCPRAGSTVGEPETEPGRTATTRAHSSPPPPAPTATRWDERSGCHDASKSVLNGLTHTPGLAAVVFANRTSLYQSSTHPLRATEITATMQRLSDHRIQPILMADVPERFGTAQVGEQAGPDCIAMKTDPAAACSTPYPSRSQQRDPMRQAAQAAGPSVPLIDLTSAYCDQRRCYSLIGGVSVYQDDNHVTATYMKTMGPKLTRQLDEALAPQAESDGPSPAAD